MDLDCTHSADPVLRLLQLNFAETPWIWNGVSPVRRKSGSAVPIDLLFDDRK